MCLCADPAYSAPLRAGFAEADVTPKVGGDKPVYIAGFGPDRKATGVHDPLFARAVVLTHDKQKIALVSVDLVGLFLDPVERIRKDLPGFDYVLVSSTHNHNGPDTLGLWGPSPFVSGIDPEYLKFVEAKVVETVRAAEKAARPVTARVGTAAAPELLRDSRKPIVLHDELVAVGFDDPETKKPAGIVVQWNCHPETLDSKGTLITSDYVGYLVEDLRKRHGCPVLYLTGTVGGLMTTIGVEVADEKGVRLKEGSFEKTERYAKLLGRVVDRALAASRPAELTPFEARRRDVYLPLGNKNFVLGWRLGVLKRPIYEWGGDPYVKDPVATTDVTRRVCMRTEVGWLKLGELEVALIPGEIYPELVLGKVPDPADPNADFPDAPVEPAVYAQLKGKHRMIVGLANDEVGYILPRRLWDEKAPFTYGLTKAPYGEVNSLGDETGPLLCRAFRDLVAGKK